MPKAGLMPSAKSSDKWLFVYAQSPKELMCLKLDIFCDLQRRMHVIFFSVQTATFLHNTKHASKVQHFSLDVAFLESSAVFIQRIILQCRLHEYLQIIQSFEEVVE